MGGFVYLMSNRKDGPLYTGVAADFGARIYAHRLGEGSRFCKKYNLTRLVYAEPFDSIEDAIAAEKRIKKWRRAWKVALIEKDNPEWSDLFEIINQ
jgi:putative endonuclease